MKLIIAIVAAVVVAAGAWLYITQGGAPTQWLGANPPNSAENAEPGSIHNLPVPAAVAAARAQAAQDAGVSEGEVLIETAFEKEWQDSCLGLGGPAESCLFVLTPGWEVSVMVKGESKVYRTNADGTVIRQEAE